MSHAHHGHAGHHPPPRARAAAPTLSLLRWSAGQRLLAASALLALLWAWIAATLS